MQQQYNKGYPRWHWKWNGTVRSLLKIAQGVIFFTALLFLFMQFNILLSLIALAALAIIITAGGDAAFEEGKLPRRLLYNMALSYDTSHKAEVMSYLSAKKSRKGYTRVRSTRDFIGELYELSAVQSAGFREQWLNKTSLHDAMVQLKQDYSEEDGKFLSSVYDFIISEYYK